MHAGIRTPAKLAAYAAMSALLVVSVTGCQHLKYWRNNNFRVGPNYSKPPAPVGSAFSKTELPQIDASAVVDSQWWRVFNDPELELLIDSVCRQNLSLKAACYRIKEARHQRYIATANLFPQSQQSTGAYVHNQSSLNAGTAFPGIPLTTDDWSLGFDVGWELDLWGRIRRSIEAADANVQVTVHDRNFAMISLIAETATLYINIRAFDERIELARRNVELQKGSLQIAKTRFDEGRTSKLDVVQATSNLAATRSLIPQLELARRQSLNALAVLLGLPPSDVPFLSQQPGAIPEVPTEVVVGIPADLLCRRPDVLSAERTMKAQFEQIGIAEADLYPTFAISGSLGWQAAKLSDLIQNGSFTGNIAPAFAWNILNYGRLKQAICVEEARLKQIQLDFENTVLVAQREVEDGIVEFIKRKEQYAFDLANTQANEESVKLAVALFREGKTDFGRVFVVQTNLVTAQDRLVETRASIALALINTYRALGGGWQTFSGTPSTIASVEAGPLEHSPNMGTKEMLPQNAIQPINADLLLNSEE